MKKKQKTKMIESKKREYKNDDKNGVAIHEIFNRV